jgi:sulfite exporter TauE/SafE
MLELIAAVFGASLLGSLHCAGMCGPFVAFCVGTERQNPGRHAAVQTAYHGGRLASYMLLGVLAGAVGAVLDMGGSLLGIQRIAMMVAGALMIGFGLVMLLRVVGVKVARVGVPPFLQNLFMRGQAFAQARHPVVRALVIGLFSILLPCGWLYMFVFAAAGTGSPLFGAVTMAVFWLGTVPILAALGVGMQTLFGPLRKHLPAAMACLLVIVGVIVIVRGVEVKATAAFDAASSERTTDGSVQQALDRVRGAESAPLPCCQHDDGEESTSPEAVHDD